MQALLSYDRSPPIAAPFRFFLTAPFFGVAAGVLLVVSGQNVFLSRWTPEALALTHLITVGFMLQVMLGALVQVLPVVAGANLHQSSRIAAIVHLLITAGALSLTAAFLNFRPSLFILASLSFIAGGGLFIVASAWAIRGVPATGPTIGGLKVAVGGLTVTVVLGALMAFGLAGWVDLPLLLLADVHLGWGFGVWSLSLLAAVAYVVVPMFQITPAYPVAVKWLIPFVLCATLGWSLLASAGFEAVANGVALALVAAGALFAGLTLDLQRRSKRARFDTNQQCWRVGMISLLAAAVAWAMPVLFPDIAVWPGWSVLCAVLLAYGGFVSVINGMLYKIVPFLVWLHLQNLGRGIVMAPNMKKVIDERAMHRQMLAHFLTLGLLIAAVFLPEAMSLPAGLAMIVSQFWLGFNLWTAVRLFRAWRNKIDKLAETGTSLK